MVCTNLNSTALGNGIKLSHIFSWVQHSSSTFLYLIHFQSLTGNQSPGLTFPSLSSCLNIVSVQVLLSALISFACEKSSLGFTFHLSFQNSCRSAQRVTPCAVKLSPATWLSLSERVLTNPPRLFLDTFSQEQHQLQPRFFEVIVCLGVFFVLIFLWS